MLEIGQAGTTRPDKLAVQRDRYGNTRRRPGDPGLDKGLSGLRHRLVNETRSGFGQAAGAQCEAEDSAHEMGGG